VASLLGCDQNVRKVLNIPARSGYGIVFPLISCILSGDYATLSVLLAHGAKLVFSPEDASRVEDTMSYVQPYLYIQVRMIIVPFVGSSWGVRIPLPVGVALVQCDEVVSLLATLGAAVDAPINLSYQPNMNLLQWVSPVIANLTKATRAQSRQESSQVLPTSAAVTWAQCRAYLNAVLPTKEDINLFTRVPPMMRNDLAAGLNEEHVRETRNYYKRAESILRCYSAVPFQSVEAPTAQTFLVQQQVIPHVSGYIHHGKRTTTVPAHLKVLYDELYEARSNGDNASIQELCLPKHLSEGRVPIQISVHSTLSGSLARMNGMPQSMPSQRPSCRQLYPGWTPFLVALHRRHWETARLSNRHRNRSVPTPGC
jgi:hypothetical protein